MGLPFRRQMLGKHIAVRPLTYKDVGDALGAHFTRVNSLVQGRVYPTAAEIAALEELIGLPIETMFEPSMLKFHKVVEP